MLEMFHPTTSVKNFAVFSGVWLVTHGAIAAAIAPRVASALVPLFLYLHVAVYVHFFALVWAKTNDIATSASQLMIPTAIVFAERQR